MAAVVLLLPESALPVSVARAGDDLTELGDALQYLIPAAGFAGTYVTDGLVIRKKAYESNEENMKRVE